MTLADHQHDTDSRYSLCTRTRKFFSETQARTLVLGLLSLATGPDSRPVKPCRASFPPEHWPLLAKHQHVHQPTLVQNFPLHLHVYELYALPELQ